MLSYKHGRAQYGRSVVHKQKKMNCMWDASLDVMPNWTVERTVCDSLCVLSLTTTPSCFLTGWHVECTTSQRAKQGCCSAVEHKSLLSSSRRRRANWCSAGVETKAAVMSLQGCGGTLWGGGMPPPTSHQPVWPPFLPPSAHSTPTTPLLTEILNVYDFNHDKEWYCSPFKRLPGQDILWIALPHFPQSFPEPLAIITGLSFTPLGVRAMQRPPSDSCFWGICHVRHPPKADGKTMAVFVSLLTFHQQALGWFCLSVGQKQVQPLLIHVCAS